MKVVLAGGSGNVGSILLRHFRQLGAELTVLSRSPRPVPGADVLPWDGIHANPEWTHALEAADVVINLAGRSVNCRYNDSNLREMMDSRILSTRVLGKAIANCETPPRLWLQASTATIYADTYGEPNDEETGLLGGDEPGAPATWKASIDIAKAWEAELEAAATPRTRKLLMRSALTLSPDPGSVFDVLFGLVRKGIGGRLGSGKQFVSWIHEADFAAAVQFLIDHSEISGPVNLSSPNPLPQEEFMRILRDAAGVRVALPAPEFLVEIGTWFMRTESELVLKSRRVIPRRLLEAGFQFQFPHWTEAARDLVERSRTNASLQRH